MNQYIWYYCCFGQKRIWKSFLCLIWDMGCFRVWVDLQLGWLLWLFKIWVYDSYLENKVFGFFFFFFFFFWGGGIMRFQVSSKLAIEGSSIFYFTQELKERVEEDTSRHFWVLSVIDELELTCIFKLRCWILIGPSVQAMNPRHFRALLSTLQATSFFKY